EPCWPNGRYGRCIRVAGRNMLGAHYVLVRFADLAATSAAVTETSGRRAKIELLADSLRRLAAGAGAADPGAADPGAADRVPPGAADRIAAGAAYLAGELRQRQTGVGWASLRELPEPATVATLTVGQVDSALQRLAETSGPGSQAERRRLVHALF